MTDWQLVPILSRGLLSVAVLAPLVSACSSSDDDADAHEAHWSYVGADGPEHWGDLSPDFAACKIGSRQSPIDIPASTLPAAVLAGVALDYSPSPGEIYDNGHTIKVNVGGANKITVGGTDYALAEFHFHKRSEHTIDGVTHAMEFHLVHYADDGTAVALGVFLDVGAPNAALSEVFAHMTSATDAPTPLTEKLDLGALLPVDKKGWVYDGSLTTPPCSEVVRFHVYETPLEASADQLAAFTHDPSARPVQPLGKRTLASGS